MRLKVALVAVFALGIGSSIALAQAGKAHDHGNSGDCRRALQGNVAPFTLTLTVVRSHEGTGGTTTGQVVTVAVGSNGQIVHAVVEGGCSSGTGTTTTTFNVRNVELRVVTPHTTTSTTKKHDEQGDDDDQGENDHHGTTTVKSTTTTTTTHS